MPAYSALTHFTLVQTSAFLGGIKYTFTGLAVAALLKAVEWTV
jgi:hypothetical protein